MNKLGPLPRLYPPALVSLNDNTYVITDDGWIKVPDNTTYEDVRKAWVQTGKLDSQTCKTFKIKSHRKPIFYDVTFRNGHWSCTCERIAVWGYHSCSHIEEAKQIKQ